MPLFKGKKKDSKDSECKEPKRGIAIAYSMKSKKKASGGTVESGDAEMNLSKGGNVDSKIYDRGDESRQKGVHLTNYKGKGNSAAGSYVKSAKSGNTSVPKEKLHEYAKEEHGRVLDEMRSDKGDRRNLAGGGEVECPSCLHKFSHGGEIANDDEPIADEMPAQFDFLADEDGLEFHDTGANSGDEDGDPDPDKKKNDLVSRAMISRKGKK